MKMKWIQKLRQIDIGISVIALVLLIAVTFAGVIFRYVFSKPFSWQEEVQLALIIWVIFFGADMHLKPFHMWQLICCMNCFLRKHKRY